MTIRTLQMPDGTIMRYDDRFIPEKVDVGEQQRMGLLGSAAGTGLNLASIYGMQKMGLLGKGGADAAGGGGLLSGAGGAGTTAATETLPSGVGGMSGEYAGTLAGDVPGYYSFAGPGLMAAGGYGLYDAINSGDKTRGVIEGGLGGAGLAGGAGMTLAALGIAQPELLPLFVAGGLLGGGAGGILAHKTTKEEQADRWKDAGHEGMADEYASHDYLAGTPGEETREEKYLTTDAIKNNPDNYNNVKDWDSWSEENKTKYLQALLDNHAVEEKRGGVYYPHDYAQQVADAIRNEKEIPTLEASQRVW